MWLWRGRCWWRGMRPVRKRVAPARPPLATSETHFPDAAAPLARLRARVRARPRGLSRCGCPGHHAAVIRGGGAWESPLDTVTTDECVPPGVPWPCELTRTAVPPAAATPAAASAVTSLKLNAGGTLLRPSRRSRRPGFEERYPGAGGVSVPTALSMSLSARCRATCRWNRSHSLSIQRTREGN
jgi:hypothetical protein